MDRDVKVQDEAGLVRVGGNPAVISNTDREAYEAFMAKRRAALESKQRIENIEKRVDNLDSKLDQILKLLQRG